MTERFNHAVTELFTGRASNAGAFSVLTPSHDNMVHHHLALVSSGVLSAGVYAVRIASFAGGEDVAVTADTGKTLDITGKNSAFVYFTGIIRGIALAVSTPLTAGETVSCVLTSSSMKLQRSAVA